ncbi:MAG: flavin reductase family protein [Candidatus Hodarchaeales archaeon]|jgi:flavin reductase (DIM6/NTAB) family NADH-FMN oxidoreductase RutF
MKNEVNISTFFYPNPVILVSAKRNTEESIITLSWAGTCCSNPPIVSIGVRPERYTYDLIKESKVFVINFPTESLLEQVEICGTKSGRDIDKWAVCNFSRETSSKVDVPSIKECPASMECEVDQIISLGTHDLFLGKIIALHIDDQWKTGGYKGMITYSRGKYGVVKEIEEKYS